MPPDRALDTRRGQPTTADATATLSHLLRMSDDAILVRSPDGRIEVWNQGAETLYGFTAEEACGRVSHELLQTRFPRPLPEIEAEVRERGRWDGELVHATKNGRAVTVSARFQLVHGEDGVDRVLETNRDITTRKQMEEALRETDRRKDAFLSMLSHELRNPLTPIRNGLAILARATPGGEQARRALSAMQRQVDLLVHLTEDLLEVTRINAGKVRLRRTRLDLVEVLRGTVEDYHGLLEPRQLVVELPADPMWMDGDRSRLVQAIGNLLQNAAKFTPADGKISVSLAAHDGIAVLEIADTGQGIDHATLQRIFEPFVQADQPIHRRVGGLGLGLTVVRAMIGLHGGEITAHSRGPGCGARFSITLPVARKFLAEPPAPVALEQLLSRESSRRR
jgi:two-component system CheB/CheR fusion protein